MSPEGTRVGEPRVLKLVPAHNKEKHLVHLLLWNKSKPKSNYKISEVKVRVRFK